MLARVLHFVFGPHTFEVLAFFLAATGITFALSSDRDDVVKANWFLGAAFLLALGRVAHLMLTWKETAPSRYVFSFLLFGAIGLGWAVVYDWTDGKLQKFNRPLAEVNTSSGTATQTPPSQAATSPPPVQPSVGTVPDSKATTPTLPSKPPVQAVLSTPDKQGQTEIERRRLLLDRLRNEYILSHDCISPALMAGTEQPPADWTNKRLGELGERWKIPTTLPTSATAPTVEHDVHETLVSGRFAQGWTLHKRGDAWTIYFIMDTDQLNTPLIRAIDGTDMKIGSELATKATAMWSDIRLKVPAPEPVRTEYGIVEGQEFVEHMTHYFREPNTIQWTYEVMQNGSGITPRPQVIMQISAAELSSADRKTIGELDALAVHTVNRRYIEAMVEISK